MLSFPNLFWFAAGIGAEVFFLGLGVSPTGMEWGAHIAEKLGLIQPFSIASGFNTASTAGAAAVASNGVPVLAL